MKTNPEDRRARMSGGGPAVAAWAAAALLTLTALPVLCGCDSKTASDKPPTPDQARAFKGGEMTASERAGMAKERADAEAYRKAHPEQFPTENSAPPAPAPPPAAR